MKGKSTNDLARGIFASALEEIAAEIAAIKSGRSKSTKFQPTERIAYLAAQASKFYSEDRKAEAAARRDAKLRTDDEVLAYARTLPPDGRSKLVRKLQALDGPRNVLG